MTIRFTCTMDSAMTKFKQLDTQQRTCSQIFSKVLNPVLALAMVVVLVPVASAQTVPCTPSSTDASSSTAVPRVSNPVSTTIVRQKKGERGIHAYSTVSAQMVSVTNSGTIVTCGDVLEGMDSNGNPSSSPSHGASASADNDRGSATAINNAGGEIETRGRTAFGLLSHTSGTGKALSINRGTIRTTGDGYDRKVRQTNLVRGEVPSIGIYAFAEGDGNAEARNERGATIETTGAGAYGIYARAANDPTTENPAYTSTGNALAINRGSVITRGNLLLTTDPASRDFTQANAVYSESVSGSSTAINTGTIDTYGASADGLAVQSQSGASEGTNSGRITTHRVNTIMRPNSTAVRNSRAMNIWSDTKSAKALNTGTGIIETQGIRSYAIFAGIGSRSKTGGLAEGINQGQITTHRGTAHGVFAYASTGGSEAFPNIVRTLNTKGARITLHGDHAIGLHSGLYEFSSDSSYGHAIAINHGTIVSDGGLGTPGDFGSMGLYAQHRNFDSMPARSGKAGDATVINTGNISLTGKSSVGLRAQTEGDGLATVEMTGGRVSAGTAGTEFGIGIYTALQFFSTPDSDEDIDIDILVSGASTSIVAHSAAADDSTTTNYDDSKGIGIFSEIKHADQSNPNNNGKIRIRITQGASVTAAIATQVRGGIADIDLDQSILNGEASFDNFNDRMKIRGGWVRGSVDFGGGDDSLTISNRGYLTGDIDFGSGTDTLVIDVLGTGSESSQVDGTLSGLESMYKRGPGRAVVKNVEMAGGNLAIENGELSVTGHLNLGSGRVIIKDYSRLSFEVRDVAASMGSDSHGRITAQGGIVFQGASPEVHIQISSSLNENRIAAVQSSLQQNGITLLGAGTSFQKSANSVSTQTPVTIKTIGGGVVGELDSSGATSGITGKVGIGPKISTEAKLSSTTAGSDYFAYYSAAAFAVILWLMREDESSLVAEYESGSKNESNGFEHKGYSRDSAEFVNSHVKLYSYSGTGSVNALAVGLDTNFGNKGYFRITAMPDTKGSIQTSKISLNDRFSFKGNYYTAQGGWRGDVVFSSLEFAQGNFQIDTLFSNFQGSENKLAGEFNAVNRQLNFGAGANLVVGDNWKIVPEIQMYKGSIRQKEFRANGSVLSAELPGFTQHYQGWKLGFQIKPLNWLSGTSGLKWIPRLGTSFYRTSTKGPSSLEISQSDRIGVLAFSNRLPLRDFPRTVHSFNAGLKLKSSRQFQVQFDFVGARIDGNFEYGLLGQLQLQY